MEGGGILEGWVKQRGFEGLFGLEGKWIFDLVRKESIKGEKGRW